MCHNVQINLNKYSIHNVESGKYSNKTSTVIQGVQKKMRRGFCLISLATNMLESLHIIHWKGGIHSFVWSTKTFLYNIREPRYKQIEMGYQISKCLNI